MKKDIYQNVTNMIIEEIENKQALPWVKEWSTSGAGWPQNSATGRAYNGINVIILWVMAQKMGYTSNEWITYKQAQSKALQVEKGEKASKVVFYKELTIDNDIEGEPDKKIPMLREYSVFNRNQLSGESELIEIASVISDNSVFDQFISNIGFDLREGEPCYRPGKDQVYMPLKSQFKTANSYYSTLLHELTHWTGHKSRLHRTHGRFGDSEYAFEELIAELGSAFQCAEFGIDGETRHAGYIESWLRILKEDKKAIFKAAAAASKACEYLYQTNA